MISSTAFVVIVGAFGLCTGSFLNVWAIRAPQKLSLGGRSFCPKCKHQLSWKDNIPIISWLLLRAQCRYCHERISAQYPLVEAGNTALWALAALQIGQHWILVPYLVAISTLLALTVTDVTVYYLPPRILYVGGAISLTALVAVLGSQSNWAAVRNGAIAGAATGLIFFLFLLFSPPDSIGFGDTPLGFFIGFVMGQHWLYGTLLILSFSLILGLLTGFAIWIAHVLANKKWHRVLPLCPWLSIGAAIMMLFGTQIRQLLPARLGGSA